jgi:hypothetical protein
MSVKHFAAKLDKDCPDWYERVDTGKLNLLDNDNCVLAQVYGDWTVGFQHVVAYRPPLCFIFDWPYRKRWIAAINERIIGAALRAQAEEPGLDALESELGFDYGVWQVRSRAKARC